MTRELKNYEYRSRYTSARKPPSRGLITTPPDPPDPPDPPAPPDPPPPPPPTTIGVPTIAINDVAVVYGQPIHVPVNTPNHAVVTITGDASPSYKWEARGSYPMLVGQQAATTTLTFTEAGAPTVTLTITDSTATDSPITYAMNFYVASQTEWEALHPEDKPN